MKIMSRSVAATAVVAIAVAMGGTSAQAAGVGRVSPNSIGIYLRCTTKIAADKDSVTGTCHNSSPFYSGQARLKFECLALHYYWVYGAWVTLAPNQTKGLGTMRCAEGPVYAASYDSNL